MMKTAANSGFPIISKRLSLSRFEGDLQGMAGNIVLYCLGINEFYLTQYSQIYEQLEAVRGKLECAR